MAVIIKTNSVIRLIQGILLLWVLFGDRFANSNPTGCENVRKDLQTRGLPIYATLDRPDLGKIMYIMSTLLSRYKDNVLKVTIFQQLQIDMLDLLRFTDCDTLLICNPLL
ncbi:hypothetical protein WA026_021854 [Henosepilachna vigintioctopunctata]|uniref:Uncharacterized protein n=1 Tax=Henosepilachna vigintioctopunctata TaxID=420089 RepID=A0AAW1UFZ2_9CUCU